ncbi:alpha-methylacyl-CoA racemase [Breoghania corrubedonensis]|uniref:Alpha-methylacyl-CoA racemase n=1 Tax=Breoghania corrubedonensis TaxID=665038 RepID=A0A2T5VGC1_9HYPH|nr:CaiB/BaiF CoA-transferase family protein [Breoghania corrubedonensis]PTW62814.1 alpha-methylacyl-CoA racemase [Breoghania corrubedonensis]
MSGAASAGPLAGLKVVEFAAIGPVPFAAMVLSDLGAEIVRIDRPGATTTDPRDITCRGRSARLGLDLKNADDVALARQLIAKADVLLEGFRPGVLERLGLAPADLMVDNPGLIVTRVTGWGQDGPLSPRAGHDLTYIALSGALHAIGPADHPIPPLNLVGDYGGGGMLALVGLLSALFERAQSGRGQVVDAAMTDGSSLLMAFVYGLKAMGQWQDVRETNMLDGAAHFYTTYRCRDGRFLAVGPIEPQFHATFAKIMGVEDFGPDQYDTTRWSERRDRLREIFLTRDRDDWVAAFDGTDACVAPVLAMEEVRHHPHNAARGTFAEVDGVVQPAAAPRFDRTPGAIKAAGERETEDVLSGWGVDATLVETLAGKG